MKWAALATATAGLVACTTAQKESLVYAPDGQDPAPSASQTWGELEPLELAPDRKRILVTADTGVRTADNQPHPDALLVRDAAAHACAGSCAASFFLGDNVYPNGVNEARDVEYLDAFTDAYLDPEVGVVEDVFFTQGNHDWGPLSPRRRRAQALHRAIVELGPRVHGAFHFYSAEIGQLRFLSLDSNYVLHHCKAAPDVPLPRRLENDSAAPYRDSELACERPLDSAARPLGLQTMEEWGRGDCTAPLTECRSRTVAVGHHPWFSNGHHGTAGFYRDFGFFSVGKGKNYRVVLENVVAPNAALYLSGHDHGVQVHHRRRGLEQLAVVVGSGGKVSPPGNGTRPGERHHQSDMVLEGFCRLGFAIIERTSEGLKVEVWSLQGSEFQECTRQVPKRRGKVTTALGSRDTSFDHDLRCRAFALRDDAWSESSCEKEASGEPSQAVETGP